MRPALDVIGRVFVVGDKPGLAQSMKLANNFLSATGMAASSEAIAMGVKAGLDAGIMVDVINSGSGCNTATTQKFPQSILPGTFNYGFGMGLMVKDVRLFLAEAEQLGIPTEVAQAVGRLWEKAMTEHGAETRFHPHRADGGKGRRRRCVQRQQGAKHERRHSRDLRGPLREHQRKAAENYIGGDPHDVLQPLDYFVWVIGTTSAHRRRHRVR